MISISSLGGTTEALVISNEIYSSLGHHLTEFFTE